MPIRFRCGSCARMLAIARRKVGTRVTCPECLAELIVPGEPALTLAVGPPEPDASVTQPRVRVKNGATAKAKANPPTPDSLPLFERPDFESLLNPVMQRERQKATETPAEPPARVPVPLPTPAAAASPDPAGIVITPANLLMAAMVVVVLIALSFAAGYLLAAAQLPAAQP